jgi:Pentapeptide repeats (8 copies)
MFSWLVTTPKRKSVTVVALALLLGGGAYFLLRLPAYRLLSLPSVLAWLTPARVNVLALLLLAAAAVVLLLGCLTAFPDMLVPQSLRPTPMTLSANEYVTAQNDVRSTLVNALAGLLLLVTAIFTWQQLITSREAQVTERYTRAVELLGNPDLAVRVGAVHSLGRLAVDSPKDDRSIYTLLTAYIRNHSPRAMLKPAKADESEIWMAWQQRQMCEKAHPDYGSLQKCAADVQAALEVLADHPDVLSDGRPLIPVLVDARLPGALCGHAQLARADLRGALLDNLDCRTKDRPYTNFERADFRGASLQKAQFGRANLRGARLEKAVLAGAQLGLADLQEATYNSETVFPAGFDPVARGLSAQLEAPTTTAAPTTTEAPTTTTDAAATAKAPTTTTEAPTSTTG